MKVFISHYGKCAMYTKEGVHIGSISHSILCALHTYMSVCLETLFAHHYWCAIHTFLQCTDTDVFSTLNGWGWHTSLVV